MSGSQTTRWEHSEEEATSNSMFPPWLLENITLYFHTEGTLGDYVS